MAVRLLEIVITTVILVESTLRNCMAVRLLCCRPCEIAWPWDYCRRGTSAIGWLLSIASQNNVDVLLEHDCAGKRRKKMKEEKRKKVMRRGSPVVRDSTDMFFMAWQPRKWKKCMKDWMKGWMKKWMKEWKHERKNAWMYEGKNGCMNERKNEWMNEWIISRMSERVNERKKEWMNVWIKENERRKERTWMKEK